MSGGVTNRGLIVKHSLCKLLTLIKIIKKDTGLLGNVKQITFAFLTIQLQMITLLCTTIRSRLLFHWIVWLGLTVLSGVPDNRFKRISNGREKTNLNGICNLNNTLAWLTEEFKMKAKIRNSV